MKSKRFVSTLCAAALLAFVTTVSTPQTYAADNIYPGEMCIKWTGAGIPKYYFGNIGNQSTTDWLYLDCPVVTPWTSGALNDGSVFVRDLHPTFDITCTLYSTWNGYSDGAYYTKLGGTKTSSGSGYKPQWLDFTGVGLNGGLPLNGGPGFTPSVTYYSCALPPSYNDGRSYLINYDVSH